MLVMSWEAIVLINRNMQFFSTTFLWLIIKFLSKKDVLVRNSSYTIFTIFIIGMWRKWICHSLPYLYHSKNLCLLLEKECMKKDVMWFIIQHDEIFLTYFNKYLCFHYDTTVYNIRGRNFIYYLHLLQFYFREFDSARGFAEWIFPL